MMKTKKAYYLVVDGKIYARHSDYYGNRSVWERACDPAISFCFNRGRENYFRLKKEGRAKIMSVELPVE